MKLNIEVREESYIKSYILILVIGILEGIEKETISLREATEMLFSPYTMQMVKNCPDLVNIIHMGTELEDIASLIPEKLIEAIREMKEVCHREIKLSQERDERYVFYELDGIVSKDPDWGNSKCEYTYGDTFIEHGSHHQVEYLKSEAKNNGNQFGQWTDNQQAADFIAQIAQSQGSGIHDVPLPLGVLNRIFLANDNQIKANMARVIVNPDNTVQVSYPFSSSYPH